MTREMTRKEILAEVTTLARERLGLEVPLEAEQRLVEDLELDSIRLLTLAVEVENHFRICLDEADEEAIETVGDLVAVIERELAAAEAPGSPGTGTV